MEFSLEVIQNLAPDQASLSAAKKLIKPAKWPMREKAPDLNIIWGQCQGSGSNPYLTMADVVDHGYKCTCPSRKFPCKHVLSLMWQFADAPQDFSDAQPPQWVQDWLGRRRKTTNAQAPAKPKGDKNIQLATDEEDSPANVVDEAAQAKKVAAAAKRAEKQKSATEAVITAGAMEFQQWVDDQLRTGIAGLLKELKPRCRQIAARMVDAKAANLASRIDELPAKVMSLPAPQQPQKIFNELSQMVWLTQAWLVDPRCPDARQGMVTAEPREMVINSPKVLKVTGDWEVVGEQITTRRDGLMSHATWLLNLSEQAEQRFALLLDYYPVSTGARQAVGRVGSAIQAELVFYPGRVPLRAVIQTQQALPVQNRPWPVRTQTVNSAYTEQLSALPWLEYAPVLLAEGQIVTSANGAYYWRDENGFLPLASSSIGDLLQAGTLTQACIVWDGVRAELLSAKSNTWGVLAC